MYPVVLPAETLGIVGVTASSGRSVVDSPLALTSVGRTTELLAQANDARASGAVLLAVAEHLQRPANLAQSCVFEGSAGDDGRLAAVPRSSERYGSR